MNLDHFWLTDAQFLKTAQHLPADACDKPRVGRCAMPTSRRIAVALLARRDAEHATQSQSQVEDLFLAIRPSGVTIELREDTSLAILQAISDGRADLGLITTNADIPAGIEAQIWRQDRLFAVVAAPHPLASRDSLRFGEILDHPLVEILEFGAISMLLVDAAQRLGCRMDYRFRVSSMDAARRLAAACQAVAIMPTGMIQPYAAHMGLCSIAIDEPWAKRNLRLISRSRAGLPAAARVLRDYLLAVPQDGDNKIAPVPQN